MKNNICKHIVISLLLIFFTNNSNSAEPFNFDVTNIEILENGNLFKGTGKGIITTENGIEIKADTFEYNKIKNILNANGNVIIKDKIQDYTIISDSVTYLKNVEVIFTKANSKATSEDGKIIIADNFKYEKKENIINATGNVLLKDNIENYIISSENITYFKNLEKISTKGETNATVQSKYKIN